MFLFFIFAVLMVSSRSGELFFPIFFTVHILTMIVSTAILIYFIINVFKNNRVEQDKKFLWAALLFFGNFLAMPVYWYLYIWKDGETAIAHSENEAIHYCPECGAENKEYAYCPQCGRLINGSSSSSPITSVNNVIDKFVPYKNVNALIGYYFGVFSLIPIFIIGIIGFILGLRGLAYARRHPEAHGTIHAWVGIIVGGLFGFGYLILTILVIATGFFGLI